VLFNKLESGLVAYETERGLFHAQAAGWQRFHLLWTFRNFNSLPVKLLNAREQRLVEDLYRTKLVHLPKHPNRDFVIGTVEQYRPAPVPETVVPKENLTRVVAPIPEKKKRARARREAFSRTAAVRRSFVMVGGAIFVLLAVFAWDHIQARPASAAAMMPGVENFKQPSAQETVPKIGVAFPATQAASNDLPTPPSTEVALATAPHMQATPSDDVSKQSHVIAEPKVSTIAMVAHTPNRDVHKPKAEPRISDSAANLEADTASRIQISRSPARIVYPSYPPTNVKGKVALKATLTVEGTVSGIEILSGDHILAGAAAKAVRRWHFAPYYRDGKAVETETNVSVSFIAPDAIVISFPSAASFSR
jgi:periplasmic protein TonB